VINHVQALETAGNMLKQVTNFSLQFIGRLAMTKEGEIPWKLIV
jgi:hypothetical protein